MKIDLLLDGASIKGEADKPARLPALEKLVARGDPERWTAISIQAALAELFRVPDDVTAIAALSLLGEGGEPGEAYWLRADPVCLQATRTQLALTPLPDGDVSADEAHALVATLQPHIAAVGELLACHPQRWYIRCSAAPRLHTEPPLAASGMLTEDRMPSGEDGPDWRRLMTEAQMLLHGHAVNDAREARGKLPVTGIWPWGGGRALRIAPPPYARVYGDDLLVRGLARASSSIVAPLPDSVDPVLADAGAQDEILVVWPGLSSGNALASLESRWIDPLKSAFHAGALSELRVLLADAQAPLARSVRRAHLRRFWRRSRPLFSHA